MQTITNGVVLREIKTGEADRILTILTENLGIVSASAKNAMRIKSKLLTSTALFSYSEFVLFHGKSMYMVNDASTNKVFHGINNSIEGLSLAMYLAELTAVVLPQDQEASDQLKLLLNSFYCISENKFPLRIIKAVYELRTLANYGYMPNLIACADCAKYDGEDFLFVHSTSEILCKTCAEKKGLRPNISAGVLSAMRHIVYSTAKKVFAFKLSETEILNLSEVVEMYSVIQLERKIKTLDFLNAMLP